MQPLNCSIVIPVHNGADMTRQCLSRIWETSGKEVGEIIVVDNGSTDGTREMLSSMNGRVRTVRFEKNLGFGRACNEGAQAASHEFVVFLNNDTLVDEQWLIPLIKVLSERKRAVVAGSRLFDPDGTTLQHAGFVIRHDDKPVMLYRGFPPVVGIGDRQRCMQAVSGASMAVRREVFLSLGGFDEVFVNGFEDIDFCLRVRKRGWQVWYVPESRVVHLEGRTEGRFEKEKLNTKIFLDRWQGKVRRDALAMLQKDGFEVINSKSRNFVLLRKGTLYSVKSGELDSIAELPRQPMVRKAMTAYLKLRHLPSRIKYGRKLDACSNNNVALPRGRDGLRIAMIHPNLSLLGGAEKLQVWMARELQERGHQVVIYTPSFNPALWERELPEEVEVRLLKPSPLRAIVGSKRLEAIHYGRVLKKELVDFDLAMCHNPPAHLWAAWARRESKSFPPCVWFCHSVSRVFYPDVAGRYAFEYQPADRKFWIDKPILHLQRKHKEKLTQRKYIRRRRLDIRAVRDMDAIVANSHYLSRIIHEVYGRDSFVCEPGIPVAKISTNNVKKEVAFLAISSRSPQKNITCVVEGFRRFVKKTGRHDVRLRVLGDLNALHDFVPAHVLDPLADQIEMIGPIHREEKLASLYRTSFATIYIAVDEAFGLVPLESMLQGTPVIASDHGGPTESVIDNQTGFKVASFDPESVARAMEKIVSLPPAEISAMRARAKQHVLERFTLARFIDSLETNLEAIVSPRPVAAADGPIETAPEGPMAEESVLATGRQ